MKNHSFGLNEFVSYMSEYHRLEISPEEVGYESLELEHIDVDSDLIPEEVKENLPSPTLYSLFTYENDEFWMVAVALEAITYRPLFLVCTADGQVVHQEKQVE